MSLTPGARVGPYEISSQLGAGGMGVVYRARDTRLNRDVALKVLPDHFAADPERLARFQREAQVLASLNHPNIAAIYGLEEADGIRALVLELVEGPALADVIELGAAERSRVLQATAPSGSEARQAGVAFDFGPAVARSGHQGRGQPGPGRMMGPRGIPVNEALPIARQIADALEAAHEHGIVHRDLKPANIKIRPDGTVKVLDFGLAKLSAAEAAAAGGAGGLAGVSQAPTLTSPAALTRMGMVLGTAAYMAPEQATGRAVDKRADVWAFGCVVYEILAAKQAFAGETVSEVLAGVIKAEPDWNALPRDLPAAVRTYLRRCLEKDPKKRVRDIGDVRLALEGGPPTVLADVPAGVRGTSWGEDDNIVFGTPGGLSRVPATGGVLELITKVDPDQKESGHYWPYVLPDGERIAFMISFGGAPDTDQVAIASLATGERRTLAQGSYPRVTSRGDLLFGRVRSLWAVQLDSRRLSLIGEPIPVLEDLQSRLTGWVAFDIADDGTLVYQRAEAAGEDLRLMWLDRDGQAVPATDERLMGIYHPPPRLSPDGSRLAVTTHPDGGEDTVVIYDLERGIRAPLVSIARMNSRFPVWTPDGNRITVASTGAGSWDIYWMPATGGAQPEPLLVRENGQVPMSWSPDGQVLAFQEQGPGGTDIWLLPRGGEPSPFIATPFREGSAAFSPDGRWLTYVSNQSGRDEVYVQAFPGPGESVRVSTNGGSEPVWAPNGVELFYRQGEDAVMGVAVQTSPSLGVGRPRLVAQELLGGEPGWPNYDVSRDGGRFLVIHDLNVTPPSLIVVQNWIAELTARMR